MEPPVALWLELELGGLLFWSSPGAWNFLGVFRYKNSPSSKLYCTVLVLCPGGRPILSKSSVQSTIYDWCSYNKFRPCSPWASSNSVGRASKVELAGLWFWFSFPPLLYKNSPSSNLILCLFSWKCKNNFLFCSPLNCQLSEKLMAASYSFDRHKDERVFSFVFKFS